MPTLFSILLCIERHLDEDDLQDSLLIRLFFARLLNPVIMPYIFTKWNQFLDPTIVENIIAVQVQLRSLTCKLWLKKKYFTLTFFFLLLLQALDLFYPNNSSVF